MHKEKVEFIFKVLKEAEVSITDFSRVTEISRETLYRWKNGGNITDMLRLKTAYNRAVYIERGRLSEKLPLPSRMKQKERITLLLKIMQEMKG